VVLSLALLFCVRLRFRATSRLARRLANEIEMRLPSLAAAPLAASSLPYFRTPPLTL